MINIGTYATSKSGQGTGGSSTVINNKGMFEPHFLWGQYFDDTYDVAGDMTDVGDIRAYGNISTPGNIDGGDRVSTTQLLKVGRWAIENYKDTGILDIYAPYEYFGPEDEATYKVTIKNKLDLSNDVSGTRVIFGNSLVEEDNIQLHSIEKDGFYITDTSENMAFGVMPDYIPVGIDIGSQNFFSGLSGWRVTNDGTAEFQNLKVNGNLDVYAITYNEMRATNGILLVTDTACIMKAEIVLDTFWVFTCTEFPPFVQNDIV